MIDRAFQTKSTLPQPSVNQSVPGDVPPEFLLPHILKTAQNYHRVFDPKIQTHLFYLKVETMRERHNKIPLNDFSQIDLRCN